MPLEVSRSLAWSDHPRPGAGSPHAGQGAAGQPLHGHFRAVPLPTPWSGVDPEILSPFRPRPEASCPE